MTADTPPRDDSTAAPPLQAAPVAAAMAIAEGNTEPGQQHATSDTAPLSPTLHPSEAPQDGPPATTFGPSLSRISSANSSLGVETDASILPDGRININIHQSSRKLSSVFAPALHKQLKDALAQQPPLPEPYIPPELGGDPDKLPPPRMNVVIHVVGSRGDVQPFVALGKVLMNTYGHRVRLATHLTFKDFVSENGLEFFDIGGDPAALMAFMVKNPGLMPGFDTLRSGDVGKRRKEIATMVKGCWRSCIESGDGTGDEASDATIEEWMSWTRIAEAINDPAAFDRRKAPFIADAIIANPPSFAHIHCAERLGCPLHLMFTMPYSPTQAFPHPLANIQSSNADPSVTNFMTYGMVDMLTWQGLGDIINKFRTHTLGLEPISLMWAPNMISRLRIPYTYCWSPALIPKPRDWGNNISISGFFFLDTATDYKPDEKLQAFLDAGPPPVYIGFGSIVVDDPNAMTKMVFDAVKKTGQRALVSKGWGGIGGAELDIPEGIMLLGNVPHDWLFQHVSCVVHHGGAGTTAAGIAAGRPTVVVPFFGDQPFWGAMVARAGAGPHPIAFKALTADKLASQIEIALKPESLLKAKDLAASIAHEKGCHKASTCFHQQMKMEDMRCTLAPHRSAVWRIKRTKIRLSALAATVLANEGYIDLKNLKLYRVKEYETDTGPTDPFTGGASALMGTAGNMFMGMVDMPSETLKALHIHPDSGRKKKDGKSSGTSTPTLAKHSESLSRASTDSAYTRDEKSSSSGKNTPTTAGTSVTQHNRHDPWQKQFDKDHLPSDSLETPPMSPGPGAITPHSPLASPPAEPTTGELSRQETPTSPPADGRGRPNAMRMALRDHLSDDFIDTGLGRIARSRSRRRDRSGSPGRTMIDQIETAYETSKGIGRIVDSGVRAPMEFSHALARGFHNMPKLYGDDTVRNADHITDFKSGLKAAGKEFGFGLYDGITGLVTQPIMGAKKEGPLGFIKGFGKGIGGIVLKPPAGVLGLAGYSMKGVFQELQGHYANPVQNYMIAARTVHGMWAFHFSTPEERDSIVERWLVLQRTLKLKRNPDEVIADWHRETAERIKIRRAEKRQKVKDYLAKTDFNTLVRRCTTRKDALDDGPKPELKHAKTGPALGLHRGKSDKARKSSMKHASTWTPNQHHDEELEAAIREKLATHATGDEKADALIEKTIRGGVQEIDPHEHEGEHDEEDDGEGHVIEAAHRATWGQARDLGHAEEHGQEEELQLAIRESLREWEERQKEEEEVRKAVEESLKT